MKIIILIFLSTISIFADALEVSGGPPACPSTLDDNGKPAFITFYGDSLGDFVDSIAHGIYGWNEYLKLHRPEVDWRVQI